MTGAERTRRYRRRLRKGIRVVPFPIHPQLVQVLISRGFLDESQEAEPAAVANAVVRAAKKICDASR